MDFGVGIYYHSRKFNVGRADSVTLAQVLRKGLMGLA